VRSGARAREPGLRADEIGRALRREIERRATRNAEHDDVPARFRNEPHFSTTSSPGTDTNGLLDVAAKGRERRFGRATAARGADSRLLTSRNDED
jgi:hypothetical protein